MRAVSGWKEEAGRDASKAVSEEAAVTVAEAAASGGKATRRAASGGMAVEAAREGAVAEAARSGGSEAGTEDDEWGWSGEGGIEAGGEKGGGR